MAADGGTADGATADGEAPGVRQRVDRWLWHARVTRTRTLAQKLLAGGGVRLNREKVTNAARLIGPGDVLTIAHQGRVRVLKVTGIVDRRLPAKALAAVYETVSDGA